jgi:hypothetical protein
LDRNTNGRAEFFILPARLESRWVAILKGQMSDSGVPNSDSNPAAPSDDVGARLERIAAALEKQNELSQRHSGGDGKEGGGDRGNDQSNAPSSCPRSVLCDGIPRIFSRRRLAASDRFNPDLVLPEAKPNCWCKLKVESNQERFIEARRCGPMASRLQKKAHPVPPIYQPEVGASAVYYASCHRRREILKSC